MKNKLPMLNKRTNFLGFKIITGMKKLANVIKNTPIAKNIVKPVIRCFLFCLFKLN
jgi:hypothetical protein